MTALTAILGDPDALARSASRYQNMAATILDVAIDLGSARNEDVYISLAMEAIGNDLQVASDTLSQVWVRYRGTADALAEYAIHLRRAQDRATQALAAANQAGDDTREYERRSRVYEDYANEKGPDEAEWIARQIGVEEKLISSRQAAQHAESEYHAARADLEIAAQAAIARIRLAEKSSGLTDPLFADEIAVLEAKLKAAYEWSQKHLAPILEKIAEIAKIVSTVLSVLTVLCALLSFIPFFAFAFAVLTFVSVIVEMVALTAALLLFLLGKRTIGEMLVVTISAAISVLAKARVTNLFESAGKAALKGVRAEPVKSVAADLARGKPVVVLAAGEAGVAASGTVVEEIADLGYSTLEAIPGISDHLVFFDSGGSEPWSPPATIEIPDYSPTSNGTAQLESMLEVVSLESTSGRQPSICVVPAGALT